jgi:Sec-independent protein translocase protein TatA
MFDISWGEVFVVGAVGAALAGRRDLPSACRFVGSQLGRVVGLLQGARVRADRFTAQNEMRQLQNELRSGLRELDQVKTELAVAASMGRSLGTTTASANRLKPTRIPPPSAAAAAAAATTTNNTNSALKTPEMQYTTKTLPSATAMASSMPNNDDSLSISMDVATPHTGPTASELPPAIQSERATMEEEWEKQGIGFRSRAEQGEWMAGSGSSSNMGEAKTGSELLANLIKQNLIFDQYDRVVGEQENEMQQRIEKIKQKRGEEGTKKED